MEWLDRMVKALDYLEKHMEEPLDLNKVSRVACSSTYHFQRMFHMVTNITIGEYVRKRKLTLAAQELASSNIRVLDVALKYGYTTPESFAKAFRKVHGISPSAARDPGAELKAYPRLSFQISLKGDKDMDYKIIDREAFRIVGKSIRVSTRDGENLRTIPRFWRQCHEDGTSEALCGMAKKKEMLGACLCTGPAYEEFNYTIGVEKSETAVPGDFEVLEIPSSTWAVFQSVGPMPGGIQKVWERIFQEWFPATGYEHAEVPELEVYPEGDPEAEEYRCEVWVPIIKK